MPPQPIDVRYSLELQDSGDRARPIRSLALPPTSRVAFTDTPTTTLTWTLAKLPIRELTPGRGRSVEISGVSGLKSRLGHDEDGFDLFAEGPDLFRELEKFLDKYPGRAVARIRATAEPAQSSRSATEIQRPEEARLVFRALWEEVNVLVEPQRFTWTRSIDSARHTYEWTITLRIYGDEAAIKPIGLAALRAIAKKWTQAVNSVTAYVAKAEATLQELKATVDAFKQPIRAVATLCRKAGDVATAAGALTPQNIAREFMDELLAVAEAAVTSVFNAWDQIPGTSRNATRRTLVDAMDGLAQVRRDVTGALGHLYTRVSPDRSVTLAVNRDVISARGSTYQRALVAPYVVKDSETLHDIAVANLGTVTAWTVLAEINGMSSPYTLSDGSPLQAGSVILVPVTEPNALQGDLSPTDVYGIDLRVTGKGDLATSGTKDIAPISGVPNLVQALTHRLLTEQLTHGVFPTYGLPRTVGEASYAWRVGLLAAHARAQFESDPRVRTVQSIGVTDNGDTYLLDVRVVPVAGKALQFTVPSPAGGT